MTKRFIKDNRGQVLYAVIVTVMFMGVISMIAMGLTLSNYHAALGKQQHVTDYYAADAVAELIRIGEKTVENNKTDEINGVLATNEDGMYTLKCGTVTIITKIENKQFKSWEVSYHAAETEADTEKPAT